MPNSFYKTDHNLYVDVNTIDAIRFRNPGKDAFGLADIYITGRSDPIAYNLTVEDMDTITWLRY
jgi:hypothetical protein